jgi:hypothetical protein
MEPLDSTTPAAATTAAATTTKNGIAISPLIVKNPFSSSSKWRKEIFLLLLLVFVAVMAIHYLQHLQLGVDRNSTISKDAAALLELQQQQNEGMVVGKNDEAVILSCDSYGGPPNEMAAEMVYWRPQNYSELVDGVHSYKSPFRNGTNHTKYLVFTQRKK